MDVGAHGFYAANRMNGANRFDKEWAGIGASLGAADLVPGLEMYVEVNALAPRILSSRAAPLPLGWGNYGLVTYSDGPWRWKLEGRDYRSMNFDFRRPPHLEEDVVMSVNIQDATSSRLQLERRFGASKRSSMLASGAVGSDRFQKSDFYHLVLGGNYSLSSKTELQWRGGYRGFPDQQRLRHIQSRIKAKLAPGEALEFGFKKIYSETGLHFLPSLEDRNYFDVSYSFSPEWSLSLGYEHVPTNPEEVGVNFFNVGSRVAMGSLQARAFLGQTSGGPQCSAGVCRVVPAFSGGYAEATYSF
jgi:hypothetical protein